MVYLILMLYNAFKFLRQIFLKIMDIFSKLNKIIIIIIIIIIVVLLLLLLLLLLSQSEAQT